MSPPLSQRTRLAVKRRSFSRLSAFSLLLFVVSFPLQSQVDPRGNVRTLATPHFRVHARVEHEAVARRSAAIAERAYAQLARELATPDGPIDLVIADNVDYSNGFAQVFPTNRVVIYAVPPVGSTELRFQDDWLDLAITHELAHIFHIDRARGLWHAGRFLFGRNPLFFPNQFTPSWVKEGLAVHYESMLTGSGRLVSTESRTVARSAARDGALPPVHRWSLSTTRFPEGQTAYTYGMLMMDGAARSAGDSGMRRYVDATAYFPIPFLLDRESRVGFGTAFSKQFVVLRDSLNRLAGSLDKSGDAAWRPITRNDWYAEAPRWRSRDSVTWVASNGRDVTGLFVANIHAPDDVQRIARRNGLDVNAPLGGDSTVFAQVDYRGPYEVRSDLYRGVGDREERLTHNARLTQPDARRRDGAIVAVQVSAAESRLVRVDASGRVTTLRATRLWADPRWSPDGTRLVAVELLPSGEQRVVVMDTLGAVQQVVAGGRAVFSSPSFTPDGRRLVWSADRSGAMQLETSPVADASAPVDTMRWREEREDVRVASRVTGGVYQPSVSPDGRLVAALVYGVNGYVVSVAPLDTTGPVARNTWYPRQNVVRAPGDTVVPVTSATTRYNPLRQLVPRYWVPVIGSGRLGQATYGLLTSGNDILNRHSWAASVLFDPDQGETEGFAAYQYRGLGVPVFDLSVSREWDATFRVTEVEGGLVGTIARRRQFATLASTWLAPSIRRSLSASLGAQYEKRDFTADVDAALGPPGSLLRTGTRYPLVFASASMSTARRGARGISVEEGIAASASSSYRWRQDDPSIAAWRHSGVVRGYLPLDLPGFSRHVLVTRVSGAVTGDNSPTELSVGGVSGVAAELLPGLTLGDPGRTFPVRGVEPGAQRGTRALGGTVEYRAPLVLVRNAPGPLTLFLDKLAFNVFSDAGRAWCPGALAASGSPLCEPVGVRDGWIVSAGGELVIDMAVLYDVPYRLRVGAAAPYIAPTGVSRKGAFYVTLGTDF